MALPKRITPDSIREAVVEIKYISDLPHELLPGIFFKAFGNDFSYTDRPLKPPVMMPGSVNTPPQLSIQLGRPTLLYNKKIAIQFLPQSFIFTCLTQYIGWADYQPQIEHALKHLHSTGHIKLYTRVGLRYITEYIAKDLREITKFDFRFGMPEIESVTTAFKSEFSYKTNKVILNLHNKVPIIVTPGTRESKSDILSRIDIDVIKDIQVDDVTGLLHVIEDVHNAEKDMYFGLLSHDFLQTLNPEY